MRFGFKDKKLRDLYKEEKGAHKYGKDVVDAFFDVMAIIEAAVDERDIRKFKGLHYEKLKGNLAGLYSLKLTGQFRLILERRKDKKGRWLFIIKIDPHTYR